MKLRVNEMFYSLQGEGMRAGHPSVFIRLQGCSAQKHCYESGIRCDTEFISGQKMQLDEILKWIHSLTTKCKWIVWTGGEPLDQLTEEHIEFFKAKGFAQAVETSGVKAAPEGIDWVCLSPKVAEHVILKNFKLREDGLHVDELRWVRHAKQFVPKTNIKAGRNFISPHFDGIHPDAETIKHCIKMCLDNPKWKLSLQSHKLMGIL